ncbi:MAG: DNA repair protein RecO [Beijerinckiaceae bacterium]
MEWAAEAIVLGTRRHGESGVILEVMTAERGRHLGLVRGGRSTRMQPVLQPGNSVAVTWRARLEEHLGNFAVEPLALRAAHFLHDGAALNGLLHAGGLLRLLPERDPHPGLHAALSVIVEHLADAHVAAILLARLELAVLAELGFGLDLSCCAATGARDDLVYVSPKSGRAVSREAGRPYADRLLPLPLFMRTGVSATPVVNEILDAYRLTGYFLNRDVFEPRGLPMPEPRIRLLDGLSRQRESDR